jgi:hypothetical protein
MNIRTNNPIQLSNTIPSVRLSMDRPGRFLFLALGLALAWFEFSPQARAVRQDACLANFNTAQGTDALLSLTTGGNNTAIGSLALHNNTSGSANTATGSGALSSNTNGINNTAIGFQALLLNTSGSANTAYGVNALVSNTSGQHGQRY